MGDRTDAEIRTKHRWTIVFGILMGLLGGAAHFGAAKVAEAGSGTDASLANMTTASSRAAAAAGDVGFLLAVLCIAAALTHRWWYFQAHQVFRRELGGPTGWLDAHDLAEGAGADGLRKAAVAGAPKDSGSVYDHGWLVGNLVSGEFWVRHLLDIHVGAPWTWCPARPVYSPWARGVGIVGPQGSGKTQFLVNMILDAVGAVVAPSTKPELVVLTRRLRARRGPTAVFNPQLIGRIGSDFAWDPLSGCTDQGIADKRAWALIRGAGGAAGTARADFWADRAQEIVRCYLIAAALAGLDMAQVMRWANDPDDPEPVNILEYYGAAVPMGWLNMLRTHLRAVPNTRTGYYATVVGSVKFMDNPAVAAACRPGPGRQFSVEELIRNRGTLYLVGDAGEKGIAPLLTALTEYIFDEAKRIAADEPGGRLVPTLNLILDECANITPVPLDRWTSDSRGWGITVAAVVQALAQFETTWGRDRAKVIWGNLPTKVILGGVTDKEDLQALSYLAGERWVQRTTRGESLGQDGRSSASTSRTPTLEPVIAGHTIANLPRWHAYVHGLGRHAAIVRYEPGYLRVAREQKLAAADDAELDAALRQQQDSQQQSGAPVAYIPRVPAIAPPTPPASPARDASGAPVAPIAWLHERPRGPQS